MGSSKLIFERSFEVLSKIKCTKPEEVLLKNISIPQPFSHPHSYNTLKAIVSLHILLEKYPITGVAKK